MGILSWLFGGRRQPAVQQAVVAQTLGFIEGPGTYSVGIVGESQYQPALAWITGGVTYQGVTHYETALIMPENGNPYDENAVRVEMRGQVVGYLDRETAATYRERLTDSGLPQCALTINAVIRGGWNRGNGDVGLFGVKIDLPVEE